MRAMIISVGKELLLGDIENTNEVYIARELRKRGVEVIKEITLNDNFSQLRREFQQAVQKIDLLIISGGLGPTEDDLTKEALAGALNLDLVFNEDLYTSFVGERIKLGRKITSNLKKQFYTIEGSEILSNQWGTAPGEYLTFLNCHIFLLPGPPYELRNMFSNYVKDFVRTRDYIGLRSLSVVNMGESQVETLLRQKLNLPELEVNTYVHDKLVEIKLLSKGQDENKVNKRLDLAEEQLLELFRGNIYSFKIENLQERVVKLCREKNLLISFAESITGGFLAKTITSCSGASHILKYSIVSYSNEVKHEELKVDQDTLDQHGAVSYETALEMARGLYQKGYCDIAIATTGEAGPCPAEKEVGKVFAAFYSKEKQLIQEFNFSGNREEIQEQTVRQVLFLLVKEFLEG
ncbi:competence damage-inducible protein A [Urinicoccus massiliensis]|uniref:Putative competence-damage inducible protein n=1 Tax=Urinicoccus massiliensis TaxID=1723382 RepID=A0A8H2M747_9FIRM|nr:CinA family nicotinamide mononucleotide deamidase-related protein [Urinicoccus massiliensis]VFB16372.1 competence damage-inducible protein A [Urinicoccus massiliensis]